MNFEATKKLLLKDLKPVKRLASPFLLAARFTAICLVYFVLYELATSTFSSAVSAENKDHLMIHSAVLLMVFIASGVHALRLAIPGIVSNLFADILIIAAIALWPISEIVFAESENIPGTIPVEPGIICSGSILLLSIIPCLVLFTIISRATFVNRVRTIMYASISTLSAGAFIMEFACPNTSLYHMLGWHVGAVLGIALFVTLLVEWRLRSSELSYRQRN